MRINHVSSEFIPLVPYPICEPVFTCLLWDVSNNDIFCTGTSSKSLLLIP